MNQIDAGQMLFIFAKKDIRIDQLENDLAAARQQVFDLASEVEAMRKTAKDGSNPDDPDPAAHIDRLRASSMPHQASNFGERISVTEEATAVDSLSGKPQTS